MVILLSTLAILVSLRAFFYPIRNTVTVFLDSYRTEILIDLQESTSQYISAKNDLYASQHSLYKALKVNKVKIISLKNCLEQYHKNKILEIQRAKQHKLSILIERYKSYIESLYFDLMYQECKSSTKEMLGHLHCHIMQASLIQKALNTKT
jgi:hypothetical protein